ncbi:RNA polymerase sigma factor [Kineococcus radiotolerans]|uniref:RNA polymerase sigma factor n=1 Tax=Kineococcus radiotolerans TaxID=131568 RepID=UPI00160BCB2C
MQRWDAVVTDQCRLDRVGVVLQPQEPGGHRRVRGRLHRSEDHDLILHLLDAIATLPLRQRAVVLLRCVEDLTVGEVAAALSITEGTVKSHVHHARSVLQAHLGPGYRDDRTGPDRRGPEPRTSPLVRYRCGRTPAGPATPSRAPSLAHPRSPADRRGPRRRCAVDLGRPVDVHRSGTGRQRTVSRPGVHPVRDGGPRPAGHRHRRLP